MAIDVAQPKCSKLNVTLQFLVIYRFASFLNSLTKVTVKGVIV